MVWISAAFGLAVVVSALLLISTAVMGIGKIELLMVAPLWLKLILILATPYFFAGMAISLVLTLVSPFYVGPCGSAVVST